MALALGAVGFTWGAATFFLNVAETRRREARDIVADREKRWLHEKRLIYVKTVAALNQATWALLDVARNYRPRPVPGEHERNGALGAALERFGEVIAEVDLLAPEPVRLAIFDAMDELHRLDDEVRATLFLGPEEIFEGVTFEGVEQVRKRALEAMRADLGADPRTGLKRAAYPGEGREPPPMPQ